MEQQLYSESELDKTLKEGGVKFLPWIGKDYENGINYDEGGKLVFGTKEKPGKKVLILGESHYIEDYDPDVDISQFTREVVDYYLSPETQHQLWMNTFTKFSRALVGEEIDRKQCSKVFDYLAFYNYLQVPVTDPRIAGEDDDYEKSQSPFFYLLEKIEPDVVIVWGNRLWNYLPDDHEFNWLDDFIGDEDIHSSGCYEVNGKTIKIFPIHHPSVRFSWDYWNTVIKNLF